MAVTTRNTNLKERAYGFEDGPVAANVNCYQDAIVMRDSAGRITNGATAAGAVGVGVAESNRMTGSTNSGTDPEVWNNTGGSAEAFRVRYRTGVYGPFTNSGSSVTAAMVGKQVCYVVDNVTVHATSNSGARSPAGMVYEVTSAGVYVLFDENLTKAFSSVTGFDALTTLTDSTGLSGTHDDTLAATSVPADLTDNSGGAAADGTIGAVTAPTAIAATVTDNTGYSGTHDDTLAATTLPAALTDNSGGVSGGNTIAVIADNGGSATTASTAAAVATLAAKIAEYRTMLDVSLQNQSDTAQKVIELVTAQGEDRTAIIALTDAVKELSTKINAALAVDRVIAQNVSDVGQKVIEVLAS